MDIKTFLDPVFSVIAKRRKNSMSNDIISLREMAVHMGPNDGYGLVITVGSGYRDKKGGQKKEHNPPHAHIYTTDKSFESRFRIDSENPPKSESEVETVSPDDKTLGKFADIIAKWAKEPSKRFQGTNWQSMRQSWKDIQDIINLGLAEPWYIEKC